MYTLLFMNAYLMASMYTLLFMNAYLMASMYTLLFMNAYLMASMCTPLFMNAYLMASMCTPLFMNAYLMANAGAVIHTHSKHAVMATLLYPGTQFRITHQEMIKGIQKGTKSEHYQYDEELVVPIIENTPHERDLQKRMAIAMEDYPDSCAVLVRRHGVYVWGPTWEKAKTMCECYDYLFEIAVEMKKCGLDPEIVPQPPKGAYNQL
ncbi:hypothetical protein DPMN_001503 [Dreissena polymorpha]|uniref:Class II aldolase/adducin N-terminal domain-containing protein n=1 Tax=Dreissena polymorpha TaxID=45954 RepID=A0A9D4MJF6_DREPO|nr:hypothetical protein DPMN_001503 [Dreissena polymorpha]